ncbi:MAG TPA: histidine triad nucleotide-binding protein [Armatimonadota bacterium]|nr:histidine triad nucleotide-binding protein [Armatimonadota bacterium]
MSCIFCRIAAGEIPANKVLENEHVVAFHDLDPKAPVHVLVIPRAHVPSVGGAEPAQAELLGQVLLACREVAEKTGVAGSGFRVALNTGPDAGQSVDHLHAHVLGGRALGWPPG